MTTPSSCLEGVNYRKLIGGRMDNEELLSTTPPELVQGCIYTPSINAGSPLNQPMPPTVCLTHAAECRGNHTQNNLPDGFSLCTGQKMI